MTKKLAQFKPLIPLILIALGITFSPELTVAKISEGRAVVIRLEDILIVIFGITAITRFLLAGKFTLKRPPLYLPIFFWLLIGTLSTLVNLFLQNINFARGTLYLLKEIEFFVLFFYVFYSIKNIKMVKQTMFSWLIIGGGAIALIIYHFVAGFRYGDYGQSLYKEVGPLPSGGFFLVLFTYLFSYLLYYFLNLKISKLKKVLLSIPIFSLMIGIFSSGSRAAFAGLMFTLVLSIILFAIKSRRYIKQILGGAAILFIVVIVVIFLLPSSFAPAGRFRTTFNLQNMAAEAVSPRFNISESQLQTVPANLKYVLFGMGKSVYLTLEESHNQYTRNLIETGIVGSIIFLILIFAVLKYSITAFLKRTDGLSVGLAAACFVTTLTLLFIGLTAEVFLVVRVMMIYWFMTAITMFVITENRPNNDYAG